MRSGWRGEGNPRLKMNNPGHCNTKVAIASGFGDKPMVVEIAELRQKIHGAPQSVRFFKLLARVGSL